jgi:hypothetical protein
MTDGAADAVADAAPADHAAGIGCRTTQEILALNLSGVSVFQSSCVNGGDCTAPMQSALDAARDAGQVLYLPPGDYLVSDTAHPGVALTCVQNDVLPDGGSHASEGRFHPCVIVGSTCGTSRVKLAHGASANATLLELRTTAGSFNDNYNHIVRGLTLDIGDRQNATALNFRAAQGSTVQDTILELGTTNGIGLVGGPGSGGSIVNVTVHGGAVGLDYHAPGEQTTVTAVTLSGQTQNAIIKGGQVTFVGVGVKITGFLGQTAIDSAPSQLGVSSALTLVDSTIDFASSSATRAALLTLHSAYLENVYVRNATDLVVVEGSPSAGIQPPAGVAPTDWVYVSDAAVAQPFGSVVVSSQTITPQSHIWGTPGCDPTAPPTCTRYVGTLASGTVPPANLAGSNSGGGGSLHAWDHLPDFQDVAATTIVRATDDLQSALDSAGDQPVLLDKGEYFARKTIHLHAHSRLIGLAPTLSLLEPDGTVGSDFASAQQFLVDIPVADADGDTLLAYVGLYYDPNYNPTSASAHGLSNAHASGVQWRGGAASQFVSPFENFLGNTIPVDGPFFDIPGGGRFYNVWGAQESLKKGTGYRVFQLSGAHAHFYEFDIEHAAKQYQATYGLNAEVTGASDIRLYGVKNETGGSPNLMALSVSNTSDLRAYGHGGNGEPGTAPVLYDFQSVTHSRVANLVEAFDQTCCNSGLGTFSVLRVGPNTYDPLERPALVVIP